MEWVTLSPPLERVRWPRSGPGLGLSAVPSGQASLDAVRVQHPTGAGISSWGRAGAGNRDELEQRSRKVPETG